MTDHQALPCATCQRETPHHRWPDDGQWYCCVCDCAGTPSGADVIGCFASDRDVKTVIYRDGQPMTNGEIVDLIRNLRLWRGACIAAMRPFKYLVDDMAHEASVAESVGHEYPMEKDTRVDVRLGDVFRCADLVEAAAKKQSEPPQEPDD